MPCHETQRSTNALKPATRITAAFAVSAAAAVAAAAAEVML